MPASAAAEALKKEEIEPLVRKISQALRNFHHPANIGASIF
jgi:hypothetical protein